MVAAAAVLLLIFVWPYISVVLMSALIAFAFNPVYKYLLKKTKSSTWSVIFALIVATLTVIIPITFILLVTIGQVNQIIDDFNSGNLEVGIVDVETVVDQSVERINSVLTLLPGGDAPQVSKEEAANTVKDIGTKLLNGLASLIKSAGTAIFGFISTFILSIFLIIGMWKNQDSLIGFAKKLSPFDNSINNLYLNRASAMTVAMIKGQFIIAAVQGTLSAFSLWLMGIDYFWFFLTILVFLSFIPLGGGILTIPIGIILIFTGNFWQGVFIILWHMLVVSSIDNILRPSLVPEAARLNSALLLLAVFSGMAIFGAPGVVFGPVIMILLVSTLEIYSHYNEGRTRPKLIGKMKSSSTPRRRRRPLLELMPHGWINKKTPPSK